MAFVKIGISIATGRGTKGERRVEDRAKYKTIRKLDSEREGVESAMTPLTGSICFLDGG